MWKILLDSVRGTSHEKNDSPCQDACASLELKNGASTILVLSCADGAGSASHSDLGSKESCKKALQLVEHHFQLGATIGEIDESHVKSWFESIRAHLSEISRSEGRTVGDYACTLLLAILDQDCAVFCQIGDGVIVNRTGQEYRAIFWPEHGEYLNTTVFVTSEAFSNHIQYHFHNDSIDDLAMMTDGLQLLALNMAQKTPHGPFFASFFERMRGADSIDILSKLLGEFLVSPDVNQRTDDDKTLVLASREN